MWYAALVLAAAVVAPTPEADPHVEPLLIRVTIVDREREIPSLNDLDLDVAGSDARAQTIDVIGDRQVYDLLCERGFSATIERAVSSTGFANPLAGYLDPSEANAKIDQLVAAYPALAEKIQYATTEQGRPVYALKISDHVSIEEDEPAVFFIAQHHAREVMSPEIAFDIATQLLTGYGIDPNATRWVDEREVFILPSHNPDGTFHVFDKDKTWRKNRRDNGDRTFGVDLNRNYPFHWNGCGGSSGDSASDGYRGPSPASEPETAGIMELAREQRPVLSLSYHTYGEQVLIPYGCPGVHAAEKAVFRSLSSDMAARLVSDNGAHWYQPGAPWEILYGEDGETNAWFYGDNGTYPFEIEANSSSQGFLPAYGQWRDSTVERNRPAWQYLLDRIDGPGISGHVTDACNGTPLVATTALDEVVFANGETPRTSESLYGRFQWLTNGGTFHLRTTRSGYTEQVWPVSVGLTRVDRPVRLVPSGAYGVSASGMVVDDAAGDGDGEADPGESFRLTVQAQNTGAAAVSGVTATLTSSDPVVTITDGSAEYGAIAAGSSAAGDGFGVSIAANARDEHVAVLHVSFSAAQPLCGADGDLSLRVTAGRGRCIVEPLDADPGWTIDNSTGLGWAFGPPAGDNGANGPAAAFTGVNVYGTNLSGPYGINADYQLITTPFDAGKLRHAALSYRRWLDNEPGFDIASVEVSTDQGSSWLPLVSGSGYGEGWEPETVGVAPADGAQDVRFRFRLRTDGFNVRSGFYVDDVSLCGEDVTKAPNGVGSTLAVSKAGSDLRLDWSPSPFDAAHDAASGYRVYRSTASVSGYAVAAQPTLPFAIFGDDAVSGDSGFFLVVAQNFGGTSTDVPAP